MLEFAVVVWRQSAGSQLHGCFVQGLHCAYCKMDACLPLSCKTAHVEPETHWPKQAAALLRSSPGSRSSCFWSSTRPGRTGTGYAADTAEVCVKSSVMLFGQLCMYTTHKRHIKGRKSTPSV